MLGHAHQRATIVFAAHSAEWAISPVQFSALVAMRDQNVVSQDKLADLISVDSATMIVLSRLTSRDLICAFAHPQARRRPAYSITSNGLWLIEKCERQGYAAIEETREPLNSNEGTQVLALLRRISRAEAIDRLPSK